MYVSWCFISELSVLVATPCSNLLFFSLNVSLSGSLFFCCTIINRLAGFGGLTGFGGLGGFAPGNFDVIIGSIIGLCSEFDETLAPKPGDGVLRSPVFTGVDDLGGVSVGEWAGVLACDEDIELGLLILKTSG